MFKWLRGLRDETKRIAEDANRIVVKSSERSEPPSDLDPIAELVRIVGEDQPALLAESSDAKKAQRTDRRRQGRR